MLRGKVPWYRLNRAIFNDNNIGGSLPYLKRLCEALLPLRLRWGAAITFNAVTDIEIVEALSRAGCRVLFMGLETFNHEALVDMHKFQNVIDKTRTVIDQCRKNGILVESGLMLNPATDDRKYMESIPDRLIECGLHIPSFICFECPIPGTPHFHRLASVGRILPNALLRDFNGYTLVSRPERERISDFIHIYKWLLGTVYSSRSKFRKLADDLPRFIRNGYWSTALVDFVEHGLARYRAHPARTYLPVTDVDPPEFNSVPLTDRDFESDEDRRLIMEPWRVTDSEGRVLPQWLSSVRVFEPKGVVSEEAKQISRSRC
jgi:hypothetical protein